jgi:hypothetical protein
VARTIIPTRPALHPIPRDDSYIHVTRQPYDALAITDEASPLALLSTRNRPRRAVRRGASWTAAYHLQLPVTAMARPVGSSVVPSESLLPSGPGLLLAQTASARRSVQPTSSGRASSPSSTLVGRQPWHRSPGGVQHRVSPIGVRRPGSGGSAVRFPAVRCPVTWGRRPGVRRSGPLLSTRPVSGLWCPPGQSPAGCCPLVRCPAGWCPPRRSGRVRLLPSRAVALGPGRCGGHPSPRDGSSLGGLPRR